MFFAGVAKDKGLMDRIIELLRQCFQVEKSELISISRRKSCHKARSLGMYLAHRLTGQTVAEIGEAFNRTESAAIHAINQVAARLPQDLELKNTVAYLTGQLLQN
ncbi:MAG: hypothetical protein LBS60_06800 [Deltaproteobacteria bacterium]|nr:hypothetical protein [Deltaproteobacteria bacterium]